MSALNPIPHTLPTSFAMANASPPQTTSSLSSYLKDLLYLKLEGEQSAWSRFKLRCKQKSALFISLHRMAQEGHFCDNWMAIFIQALPHSIFHCMLRRILLRLSPESLLELFNYAIRHSFTQITNDCVIPLIGMMNEEEIHQILVALQKDTVIKEVTDRLLSLLAESHTLRKNQEISHTEYLQQSLPLFLSWIHQFLEAFLEALNFFLPGSRIGGPWEASHRLSIYWYLLGLPALLFSAYLSMIGSVFFSGIAAVATLVSAVALLKTYLKWLRPCPDNLDICFNLTRKVMEAEVDVTCVRNDLVQEILDSLSVEMPVLIHGPSGVGKSMLFAVIARKIALNINVPSCLQGAKVFLLNTAKLLREYEGVDRVECIRRALGAQKNRCIICWEEFASIFEKKGVEYDSKSVFDKSVSRLPYSIVVLTDDEFKKIERDPTWARRFKSIEVRSLEKEQTVKIMREKVRLEVDHEVSTVALERIYDATKSKSQPDAAMVFLDQQLAVIKRHEMCTKKMCELSKLKMQREDLLKRLSDVYYQPKEHKEVDDQLRNIEQGTKDSMGIEKLEHMVNGDQKTLAARLAEGKQLEEKEHWKLLGETHLLNWYKRLKKFRREQAIFMESLAYLYHQKEDVQSKGTARKQFLMFYAQIMPSLRDLISRLQHHLEIPNL